MKRRSVWVVEWRLRGGSQPWASEGVLYFSAKEANDRRREANRLYEEIVHRVVRYDASK